METPRSSDAGRTMTFIQMPTTGDGDGAGLHCWKYSDRGRVRVRRIATLILLFDETKKPKSLEKL